MAAGTVIAVRIKQRPFAVAVIAVLLGIWGGFLILAGLGILIFSWWTDFGNSYEIFGLSGPLAGLVNIVIGLVYLGLAIGLWRMFYWAWIVAFVVTIFWVIDSAATLFSSSPHYVGFVVSIFLAAYLFLVRRNFRGIRTVSG